jgi:hypothetical protein
MKKIYKLLLFLLIGFILSNGVEAQYYVSLSGSDNNPGTLEQPFKTIQKAADIMVAGDTCFIMEGKYREEVIPANNGDTLSPIVFVNYNNERVVILGSDTVSAIWEPYQNNIYKVWFPDSVLQLFVNKKRAFPARYPDFESADIYSTSDWKPVYANSAGDARFTGMNKPEGYWTGGYCKILTGKKWIAHVGKISASAGDIVHCDERSFPWNNYNPSVYLGNGLGYIIGHIHALDNENEWFWQNDTLYYYPKDNEGIDTSVFEVRTRNFGFNCQGKEYITIKNIHFVWASVTMEDAKGCTLDGGSVWFPLPFYFYATGWGRNSAPPDYTIDAWDGKGVVMSGTGNAVKNCYIAYSWGDGISVGGVGNRIENCIVENCDWSATDAGPLCATGKNHNILHNTFHTSARSILVHRKCDNTNIKYNHLYDCGLMCDDLGLTYSYETNGAGSEIAYNWVHDNHASGTASGIYLDNKDTAYVVHHNVIWNCRTAVRTNKPAVDHEIYNNTAWNCSFAQGAWGPSGTHIVNQKLVNNLSDKPWNIGTYFNTNLVTDNPMFVDPDNGDFRLLEGSPAIDYGTVIPGITDGYAGDAPDAGAYEFGGEDWTPGSNIEIPDLSDIVVVSDSAQQGLIAYYPFNGNADDESGNGYNPSAVNAMLTTDRNGNPNSAYAFNGTDSYIEIPHIGINLSNDFSITYWFLTNNIQTRQWLFGNRHTASGNEGNGLESHVNNGALHFFWPAQLSLSAEITPGEWCFVSYLKSGDSYKLYINAGLVCDSTSYSSPANNDPWRVGAQYNQNGWGAFLNGKMDDIRIYGRALTEEEITNLYNGDPTGYVEPEKSESPVLYIYPNPGTSVFKIENINGNISDIKVFDITGKLILQTGNKSSFDLSEFGKGLYFVKVSDVNANDILTAKIVKE